MIDLGDRAEDSVIYFEWNSNDGDGGSVTRATDGTVAVYKDDNTTETSAGVTDTEDHDGDTGVHKCKIDTSADAFYATGADYAVRLKVATIDGQTVNATLATFSIENRFNEADVVKWNGTAVATPDTAGYPKVTVKSGSGTGEIDLAAGKVDAGKIEGSDATDQINAACDTAISDASLATAAALATVDTVVDAIKAVTDSLPDGGALSSLATAAALTTVDTVVDAIKVVTDALTAAAAAKLALSAGQIVTGTVDNDVAPTTTVFEADDITEATADHFNGRIVIFTSGNLAGQATDITDYELNGSNGKFTVTALTEAPANDDTFIII